MTTSKSGLPTCHWYLLSSMQCISSLLNISSICRAQGSYRTNYKIRATVGFLCPLCAPSAQLIIWPLLSSWLVEISQWKTWHQRRRPHVVISLEKDSCSLFKEALYFFGENWISYRITSDHELSHVPHSVESFMCKTMKETTSRCADHWKRQVNIIHIHLSLPY